LFLANNPQGVRLGGAPIVNPDTALNDAVQIASKADVVIAVIGLNGDWETEGEDRENLDLPGRTNELIERVAAVNPNTIVVNQSVRISSDIHVVISY
jgi:beta-glucosidase